MNPSRSKSQPGVSVLIIAKNEEKILYRTLKNIRDVASEIIFVDTGSNDRTVDIAHNFDCNIFNFHWCDDFSKAKNFGIEKAKYNWILNIDADEVLYDKDAQIILKEVCRIKEKPAFVLWQDNLYDDGSIGHVKVMRLFQNNPRIRFVNPVHESVCDSVYKNWPEYVPEVLDIHLRHYGHLSSNASEKHERNLKILQKWVASNPEEIYANYKLAMTLFECGKKEQSFSFLERAFSLISMTEQKNSYPFVSEFVEFYYGYLIKRGFIERAFQVKELAESWM